MELPEPRHVLALGCGTGRCLEAVATIGATSLVGLDVNAEAIRQARSSWRMPTTATFVTADANSIPFDDHSFDLVIAQAFFTVVPTLAERTAVVDEVRRVLRPGCYFYIGDFLQDLETARYLARYESGFEMTGEYATFPVEDGRGRIAYFAHHFGKGELQGLLEGEGFEVVLSRDFPVITSTGHQMQGLALIARLKL
jgi:ubiquinone/menaquinone biosynthesis C-methylase UbiE